MRNYLLSVVVILVAALATNVLSEPRCEENGPLFIKDPLDCQSYFVCLEEGSEPIPAACPDGYNFNQAAQKCDHADAFPCEESEVTEPTAPTEPENEVTEPTAPTEPETEDTEPTAPTEPETEAPTAAPTDPTPPHEQFVCPDHGIYAFPIENSCTDFHFCFSGQHAIGQCAAGLHFDANINDCAKPELARCFRDICPSTNDIDHIVTIKNPEKCNEFAICYDGEPWHFVCSEGLFWNQPIQRCDYPENVECRAIQAETSSEENGSVEAIDNKTPVELEPALPTPLLQRKSFFRFF